MPITIVEPVSGGPFGPGFRVEASSTFVGPILDPFWEIRVTDLDDFVVLGRYLFSSLTGPFRTFGNSNEIGIAFSSVAQGDNVHVHVELSSGSGVVESSVITSTWDQTSGAPFVLQEGITAVLSSIGSIQAAANALISPVGATQTKLDVIKGSVTADIGISPNHVIEGLVSLINRPPLAIGHLSSPPITLTGDGFIPVGSPAAIFGLYWVATVIPAGMGKRNGNSVEYQQRLVQFRTVHTIGGVDLVTEVADFNTHGQLWVWQIALPTRVEYSVTPGIEIQVRWWQLP